MVLDSNVIWLIIIIFVIFILWLFWGGKNYEFIGYEPIDPTAGFTGTAFDWGNTTLVGDEVKKNFDKPRGRNINRENINRDSYRDQIIDRKIIEPQTIDRKIIEPQIIESTEKAIIPVPKEVIVPKPKAKFTSRGERTCNDVMEKIYGVKFETVRPAWLKNPETNRALELDCYNEQLKIAIEYNGIQHYVWPNFTGQNEQQFLNQVRRDELKKRLCDRQGVYLITVPYDIGFNEIENYIVSRLPENIRNK